MAASNYVAAEDGLEDDPKLQTLARLLKVSRPIAFWFVMRWQRLVFRKGSPRSGSLPKSYTKEDIAAFLEFKGAPKRLVDAMKKQGYLSFKKGHGYFYPAWNETITGRFALRKEKDRLAHEQTRQEKKASATGRSNDVDRLSADASADGGPTSSGDRIERKKGSGAGLPPDPPPAGGALVADARWDWVQEHAPTAQNSKACKAILGSMSVDIWELVQRAYNLLDQPGASMSKKNRRVLYWPTDQFLRKEAYLRFLPRKRPNRTAPRPIAAVDALVDIERRLAGADRFLMESLCDPDESVAKKQERRERWLADPANKDRPRPWEGIAVHENGVSAYPTASVLASPTGSK